MVNINNMFPSKWITSDDVGNQEFDVTIERITYEEVGQNEHKYVLWFRGAKKGMVLNKTNGMDIAYAYGDDSDGWIGGTITLYTVSTTDPQGKPTRGIRVKIRPQPAIAAQPEQPMAMGRPVEQQPAAHEPIEGLEDEIPF